MGIDDDTGCAPLPWALGTVLVWYDIGMKRAVIFIYIIVLGCWLREWQTEREVLPIFAA